MRNAMIVGLAIIGLAALPSLASAALATWNTSVGSQVTPADTQSWPDQSGTYRSLSNEGGAIQFGQEGGTCGTPERFAGNDGTQPVPEPATLLLVGIGSLAMAATRRKRK